MSDNNHPEPPPPWTSKENDVHLPILSCRVDLMQVHHLSVEAAKEAVAGLYSEGPAYRDCLESLAKHLQDAQETVQRLLDDS